MKDLKFEKAMMEAVQNIMQHHKKTGQVSLFGVHGSRTTWVGKPNEDDITVTISIEPVAK